MNKIYKVLMSVFLILILSTAVTAATMTPVVTVTHVYNRPIVINSLEDLNKFNIYYGFGFNDWSTRLQATIYRNKISLKQVEEGKGQITETLSPFSGYSPGSGNHHAVFSSPSTLNIYFHPNSKLNKYVTIEAYINNTNYVINAYGATYLGKSYGKEVTEISCTKGGLLYRLLPTWIFYKYDKSAHFSDCTQPLNLDYYINLKERGG